MPACHIDDARRRCLAFLNDPKLLDRRPSSPSLRTRQNRNLAHVCSFACKSISKPSQAKLPPGRRSSPEGYSQTAAIRAEAQDAWAALVRPVVRRRAGFHTDQTWRQLREERQHIATLQLLANNHLAASVRSSKSWEPHRCAGGGASTASAMEFASIDRLVLRLFKSSDKQQITQRVQAACRFLP